MSESLLWFVGNRNPSITQAITINGVAVDLTSSTVTFSMRLVGATTPKVNAQPATIVGAPTNGNVRYDWASADVDTAGQYLIWWTVTTSGKTQDVAEAVIEFRAHANAFVYVELEQLKTDAELTGEAFADQALKLAAGAASRAVDKICRRRFWLDTGTNNVRYYSPRSLRVLPIDDLVTLTSVAIDRAGSGSYSETWTSGTDFVLEPFNAPVEQPARPYEVLRVRYLSGRWLPAWVEKSVQVTGQFGWTAVPDDVRAATQILAARTVKRIREAPLGVIGGLDGVAMHIARTDPDVGGFLADYRRNVPFIT